MSLSLWLFGIIIVGFAMHAWHDTRTANEHWEDAALTGALRFTDLVRDSTRYGMLLNRKEDVQHIVDAIAQEPGIEGVRIFDKRGTIIFSGAREDLGHSVDVEAEACSFCHEQSEPSVSVPVVHRKRIEIAEDGTRVLGLTNPIENLPACWQADCHAHPEDQEILGVIDVRMSLADTDARLATVRREAIFDAILIALGAGLASALFIYVAVRRPVKRLIDGTQRIAEGDLSTEIEMDRRDEMGQLAGAFNRMTSDLSQAREELTRWSDRLETKLVEKTDELNRTQRQVVHMEKMASLGKLSATVAHELNNPLAGVLNYSKLVERTIREGETPVEQREELERYLGLIQKETSRCGDIVRNLLLFARRSGTELTRHSLNAIIDRSLMLVRHHMDMAGVHLELQLLAENDKLICDGNEIQQALVALLVNAIEAMPEGGLLTVEVMPAGESIVLDIRDTGIGIPENVLPHIFEPFFSTKNQQNGVGLGLAVVYGIVRRHGGDIQVESELDVGTTFRLILQRSPKIDGEQERPPAGALATPGESP